MLSDLIKENADKYKIDKDIISAIISTESGFDINSVRYEQDYRWIYKLEDTTKLVGCTKETMLMMQKTSWGLMQLMGAVYYELGGSNWATILLSPGVNLKFACEHLANLIKRYSLSNPADIYAAYNAGSIKKMKSGEYVNQNNVDRFNKHLKNIKMFI